MRKYFLTSAVALLSISTANATTDYAEVTARATIEVANTMDCTDLDFGTIVVKKDNGISTVNTQLYGAPEGWTSGDIISATNLSSSVCVFDVDVGIQYPSSINLVGPSENVTAELSGSIDTIFGVLTIPAKVTAGEYEGHFTVTRTY